MELAAVDIAVGHGGGEVFAVFSGGDHSILAAVGVIGVDEIHAIALPDVLQQRVILHFVQAVPANVGDF